MSADADIALCLADGEDTFTFGDRTVPTVLSQDDAVDEKSRVILGTSFVILLASQFADLRAGDPVTVNNVVTSVVQTPMRIQDGRVLQVWLADRIDPCQ